MTLGESLRLQTLLDEARRNTEFIENATAHLQFKHSLDTWLAIRIICETILGKE